MPARTTYSLARYRAEAKREPFELVIDSSSSVVIVQPSGEDLLAAEQATSSREAIKILAGDQYEELMKVLGAEPAGVLKAVIADIRDHFGLGETDASRT
jgi:hypothetical protein